MSTRPTKEKLSMRKTLSKYADVFADEHEPIYSPTVFSPDIDWSTHPGNEIVGPLARLLGINYRDLHALLMELNSKVYIRNGAVVIAPDALQLVCEYITLPTLAEGPRIDYSAMSGN